MKSGTRFTATYKDSGNPVMVKIKGNVTNKVALFTVIQLCSYMGQPEWYDCEIKGHPLPKTKKGKKRVHQLFTKYFNFHLIGV
jgi:hypothetical protein